MFSQKTSVSARDFLSLLGQLNAAADLVMLGRLHLPPLQISLPNQWKPQNLPYCHQIGMTTEILQHLKWWLQEDLYHQGIPLRIDPPSNIIFTDARLSGWGAHVELEGLLFHGVWTEDQSRLHINVLEMKAIFLSLLQAGHKVKSSTVLVSTDNTTVVAYIRHQGGTHSTELSEEVWNVLNLCLAHNIQLLVKHVQGRFNTLCRPDVQNRQTDLHRVVPESGSSKQDFPDHGLSINRPVRHTSEPQDAILCVTYTGSEGTINRCPHHGLESHTCICVSIVPSYTSCDKQNAVIPVQDSIDSTSMARQTMVSRASRSAGLLVSPPVFLPVIPNLLAQLKGRILHQNPGHLQLHAWELSNNHSEIDNFQAKLRSTSPKLEGNRLLKSMRQNGKSSVIRQINGRLILSRPLPR